MQSVLKSYKAVSPMSVSSIDKSWREKNTDFSRTLSQVLHDQPLQIQVFTKMDSTTYCRRTPSPLCSRQWVTVPARSRHRCPIRRRRATQTCRPPTRRWHSGGPKCDSTALRTGNTRIPHSEPRIEVDEHGSIADGEMPGHDVHLLLIMLPAHSPSHACAADVR